MIITLKDTSALDIASQLLQIRQEQGGSALGRVLTLIVVVDDLIDVDHAIEISQAASHEHPCRVIVVVEPVQAERSSSPRVNAQIRMGKDEGPSEVIVLEPRGDAGQDLDTLVMPLLLADTPVVTFWPSIPPENPAEHPLGRLAVRRISDSRETDTPIDTLLRLSEVYTPGDTDLAWSGVTLWRALIATMVEGFKSVPTAVTVRGHHTHPSSYLVAAWLADVMGIPSRVDTDPTAQTITGVHFTFDDAEEASLTRPAGSSVAHVKRSGLDPVAVNLPRRSIQDCVMEELRRLDPDLMYQHVIGNFLHDVHRECKGQS